MQHCLHLPPEAKSTEKVLLCLKSQKSLMNLWASKRELNKQFKYGFISSVPGEIKSSRRSTGLILILFILLTTWKNNECICKSCTLQNSIFCHSLLTCYTLYKFMKITVSVSPDIDHLSQKIPQPLLQNSSLQKHYLSLDLHRLKQMFREKQTSKNPLKKTPKPHTHKKKQPQKSTKSQAFPC